MAAAQCEPLNAHIQRVALVVLCVPLMLMVVLKLNRKARLVPGRYMGWVAVAVKAGVLWEVLHLIWCATPEEHTRACREAAREVHESASAAGGRDRTVHRYHVDRLGAALARCDAIEGGE